MLVSYFACLCDFLIFKTRCCLSFSGMSHSILQLRGLKWGCSLQSRFARKSLTFRTISHGNHQTTYCKCHFYCAAYGLQIDLCFQTWTSRPAFYETKRQDTKLIPPGNPTNTSQYNIQVKPWFLWAASTQQTNPRLGWPHSTVGQVGVHVLLGRRPHLVNLWGKSSV